LPADLNNTYLISVWKYRLTIINEFDPLTGGAIPYCIDTSPDAIAAVLYPLAGSQPCEAAHKIPKFLSQPLIFDLGC
jgi:hypothetical protein